ncbi:hypothetical protein [Streptomyces solaniscabiei]|nr:hypothetical protein [Streptomyces solaniscabiei]
MTTPALYKTETYEAHDGTTPHRATADTLRRRLAPHIIFEAVATSLK